MSKEKNTTAADTADWFLNKVKIPTADGKGRIDPARPYLRVCLDKCRVFVSITHILAQKSRNEFFIKAHALYIEEVLKFCRRYVEMVDAAFTVERNEYSQHNQYHLLLQSDEATPEAIEAARTVCEKLSAFQIGDKLTELFDKAFVLSEETDEDMVNRAGKAVGMNLSKDEVMHGTSVIIRKNCDLYLKLVNEVDNMYKGVLAKDSSGVTLKGWQNIYNDSLNEYTNTALCAYLVMYFTKGFMDLTHEYIGMLFEYNSLLHESVGAK